MIIEKLRHSTCKTELIKVDSPQVGYRYDYYCPSHDCRHLIDAFEAEIYVTEFTVLRKRFDYADA